MARQNSVRHEGVQLPAAESAAPIPDKLCFRIGEVARICAVPSYVLRFWEREFPQLRPAKGGSGQRLYRRRDVEMALRVRQLLYDEGYTIPGARQWLRAGGRGVSLPGEMEAGLATGVEAGEARLRAMRAELEEIVRMLGGPERRRTVQVGERQRHPVRRRSVLDEAAMPLFEGLDGSDLVSSGDGERSG